MSYFKAKMHQIRWGAYSAYPYPTLDLRGSLLGNGKGGKNRADKKGVKEGRREMATPLESVYTCHVW